VPWETQVTVLGCSVYDITVEQLAQKALKHKKRQSFVALFEPGFMGEGGKGCGAEGYKRSGTQWCNWQCRSQGWLLDMPPAAVGNPHQDQGGAGPTRAMLS
jgi:hypothetical protein